MSKLWSVSPSVKLILFMVSLILVAVLFSVSRSNSPGRILLSPGYSWLRGSTRPSFSDSSTPVNGTVTKVDSEPPRRVRVVDFDKTEEDAVLDSASDSLPPAPAASPNITKLEKLEARLNQARVAIRDATTNSNSITDPDYTPIGSIYINATVFHRSLPYLEKNSILALCNANTSEGFEPSKDASFPEINLKTGHMSVIVGGPSPSQRPILAFFEGGVHGPIRPILLEHWQNKCEPDMQVHQYLPRGVSYEALMKKSKFCICPSGYEVASPRVVEAIYTGCVPVLISDHYVPQLSDVLNWKAFSVEVAVNDIPNLKKILEGISSSQYKKMQRKVVQVRRHFVVNSPPKRFDVFHMILHSVWLRRLNIRLHDT